MRVGARAWGLQYHVEIEETTIPDWANIPAYAEALERTQGAGAVERMAAEAQVHMTEFAANAKRLYDNFMGQVRG